VLTLGSAVVPAGAGAIVLTYQVVVVNVAGGRRESNDAGVVATNLTTPPNSTRASRCANRT
jgi:hypothetical protein